MRAKKKGHIMLKDTRTTEVCSVVASCSLMGFRASNRTSDGGRKIQRIISTVFYG